MTSEHRVLPHDWRQTDRYHQASRLACRRCGAVQHYSWMPGWPGWTEYYSADGDKLDAEPDCVTVPVGEVLDASQNEDNWSLAPETAS